MVVALALRLNGLNWDSGYGFHPDERSLYLRAGCMYDLLFERPGYDTCLADHPEIQPGLPSPRTLFEFERSPLNPHWFPLGSALIYVLVACRAVIELLTDISALDMRYVGRVLSALADVGSVAMVYLLGRKMYQRWYGPWVGLLSAALVAFAVIHVQHSHFYRPETFAALGVLGIFWAMLRVIEKRRLLDSLVLGAIVGAAFAPKVSILPITLPLAICYYYRLKDAGGGRWSTVTRAAWEQNALHALAALAVALAVFAVLTPYGVLYLSNFLGEQAAQTHMAQNAGLWPFTIQYVGTPAFLYQFHQVGLWGLGPALGVVAWAAIPFTALVAWRSREASRSDVLVLAWLVPSILFLESFEVRFQRYYFALVPFMILLGSRMILWLPCYIPAYLLRKSRRWRVSEAMGSFYPALLGLCRLSSRLGGNLRVARLLRFGMWGVAGMVVAGTVFYSLGFQQVYLNPHPAVAASRWLNSTLDPGAIIVSDNHWDEFIPELYDYSVWQFPAYEPDRTGKMAELAGRLADAEYLVFYSQRPYVSVASDPERFPQSYQYYRRLFAGHLGYQLERGFASHPSLPGVTVVDDPFGRIDLPRPDQPPGTSPAGLVLNWGYADDNVVGYDHPTVLIFRNVQQMPAEALLAQLVGHTPQAAAALKYSEVGWATQRQGGTWAQLFNRDGLANRVPVLSWLIVVEVIYLLTLPLALFLFRPLADRGLVLARILGLGFVAYLVWIAVSLGWFEFSRGTILVGMAMLGLISGGVFLARRREMVAFLRQRWRLLGLGEVVFLVAFFAFLVVRALNPDLWHPFRGGEKPMEFAYFNAVLRSTLLPPYDPWFAGGYLNYYYWGYFILSIPARLTGIVPPVAFNLAVPLLFALTVSGAYSVVYNLAEGYRRSRPKQMSPQESANGDSEGEEESDSVAAGGTRAGPGKLLRSPITAGLTGGLFVAVIGNLDGLVQLLQNGWGKWFGQGDSILPLDFWRSSRLIPNMESVEPNLLTFWLWGKVGEASEVSWHIAEFPFFTFLFADLHAHMMVIPFSILVIGLGLNLALGFRRFGLVWDGLAVMALGVAVGSLWAINSWDYPSYLLLAVAAALLAVLRRWNGFKSATEKFCLVVVAVVTVGIVAFLPFHQWVETFGTGIEVTRWKTPLVNFLGIFGLFAIVILVYLVWQARHPLLLALPARLGARLSSDPGVEPQYPGWLQRGLKLFLILGVGATGFFLLAGYVVAALAMLALALTGLVAVNTLVVRQRGSIYGLFSLVLVGLGFGLVLGVDLVRVEDDIGRMNTLFKYYLEVWVLFALASAFFLWRLWYDQGFHPAPWGWLRLVWAGLIGFLVLASLVYTVLGSQDRLADRFNPLPPTLDGMAYMEDAVHWEKDQAIELKWDGEAIRWLQDNVAGSPVIMEAHTEQYRWGARMANYTGLPTVLGWPWHQMQQRGPHSWEVHQRARDIERFYTTTRVAQAQRILDRYEVGYVVVGDLERVFYPEEGMGKFDIMVKQGNLVRVFDNGHTAIYRVAAPLFP